MSNKVSEFITAYNADKMKQWVDVVIVENLKKSTS